jgi:membrane protease YdiL (CAAX protease family)
LGTLLWLADPYKEHKPATRAQSVTRQLLLGFALGLAMKVPADALRALIDVVWPTPDAERQAQAELLRHDTVGQVIGLVVVVGIVGPIVEELFYRGSLFGDFRRALGRAGAVVLSSVLFALAHASPRDWLPLILVALALGLARQRTSALWASTGAHVAFNLAALGLLLVGREVDVLRSWVWGAIGLVSLGLSAGLLRAIR